MVTTQTFAFISETSGSIQNIMWFSKYTRGITSWFVLIKTLLNKDCLYICL